MKSFIRKIRQVTLLTTVTVTVTVAMLAMAGCAQNKQENLNNGNGERASENVTENVTTITEKVTDNNIDNNTDNNTNEPIEFSDFLVERCVREQLNKSWDEKITYGDVEKIKKLYIICTYDPTFVLGDKGVLGGPDNGSGYSGYIDLVDVQYFINLEELYIDVYAPNDTIVNVETIASCKKLKSLSISCADGTPSYSSINIQGYKYWADIVAKLPELEYMDLGIYVDEHMKEVILSKTNNKDIEFYQGPVDVYSDIDVEVPLYMTGYNYRTYEDKPYYFVDNSTLYNDEWDYEYRGIAYRIEKNIPQVGDNPWMFPAIKIENEEELAKQIRILDKDIEDIIIVAEEKIEIDFSLFDKFDNLITLTILGQGLDRTSHYQLDEESGVYWQVYDGYLGLKAKNLDALATHKHLQVINFYGFVGDLSDLSVIEGLRELSLIECALDAPEFLSNMKDVRELVLLLYSNEGSDEKDELRFYNALNTTICSLSELKYYRDQNDVSIEGYKGLKNIKNMKLLETLYVEKIHNKSVVESIVKSSSIENLFIKFRIDYDELTKDTFVEMKSLKNLHLAGTGATTVKFDYSSLLNIPNIISIVLPYVEIFELEQIFTDELASKVADNEKISAFKARIDKEFIYHYMKTVDKIYNKKLYEAGIDDGIYNYWLYDKRNDGVEVDFNDFLKSEGK